ncbi:MAG TPA: YhgE/Pip domain-containing protein, partial [Candidatus Pseudogracilibacillus intestinigallinarum]|nr:YhgE/Pip domain-containing protein [Candidatus Pseudogracilibacillus intestinigallinarum]
LKEEIDALMEKYDKSNFDMVSFVSNKNEKVEMVQFVMKTEPIETKEELVEEEEEDEKTMWQRFLDLFSWLKFW